MKRPKSTILSCLTGIVLGLGLTIPAAPASASTVYALAVFGDTPYGTTALNGLPARINQMNADPQVQLVSHLGDISSGNCSDSYYAKIRSNFDRFADPLVYTPGDNEWADCHRADVGRANPLNRLSAVRKVFFPTPGRTLGQNATSVTAQSGYPENIRVAKGGVTIAAVHAVGSYNDLAVWSGLGYTSVQSSQRAEFDARTSANASHIKATFAQAKANGSRAVVLLTQADMFLGSPGSTYREAFKVVVRTIAAEAKAYGKPVFLFNGDSHAFLTDKPLTSSKWLSFYGITSPVPNLTRYSIEGGSGMNEWLRVRVVTESNVISVDRVNFT